MADKTEQDVQNTSEERRKFLAKAGKVSLGVPATALLVSVAHKRARATGDGSGHSGHNIVGIVRYIINMFS